MPEEELEGLELGFVFVLRVEFVVGFGVGVGLGVAVGTVLDAAAAVCAEA